MDSLSIRQIFKDVTFNLNVFEKGKWQPIDDQIITEIHETCEMLPCSFPHSDYLKDHRVVLRKDKHQIMGKKAAKKEKKLLKIQPEDDSGCVQWKLQHMQLRKKKIKKRTTQMKMQKKVRQRVKRKEIKEILTAEAKEYESTKKLLVATMDHYSTSSGQSLNVPTEPQNLNIADCSIATRTRRQSKCVISSNKSSIPNVRRSNRVNKFK